MNSTVELINQMSKFSLFAPPELIDSEAPLGLDPLNAKQVFLVQMNKSDSPTQQYYIYMQLY